VPDDDLLSRIAQGANLQELREILVKNAFVTLRSDGMAKVKGGLTTAEEVLKATVT
jgi:type II secretory ATPase GspE/PulE/Tfp pilus assembly ATPase PilB-like protein